MLKLSMYNYLMGQLEKDKFSKFKEKELLYKSSKEPLELIISTHIVNSQDQSSKCLFLMKCWEDHSMDQVSPLIMVHQFLPKISSISKVCPSIPFNVFTHKK